MAHFPFFFLKCILFGTFSKLFFFHCLGTFSFKLSVIIESCFVNLPTLILNLCFSRLIGLSLCYIGLVNLYCVD